MAEGDESTAVTKRPYAVLLAWVGITLPGWLLYHIAGQSGPIIATSETYSKEGNCCAQNRLPQQHC